MSRGEENICLSHSLPVDKLIPCFDEFLRSEDASVCVCVCVCVCIQLECKVWLEHRDWKLMCVLININDLPLEKGRALQDRVDVLTDPLEKACHFLCHLLGCRGWIYMNVCVCVCCLMLMRSSRRRRWWPVWSGWIAKDRDCVCKRPCGCKCVEREIRKCMCVCE
jgi:hypothetical protein